jgi:hypothetical protein
LPVFPRRLTAWSGQAAADPMPAQEKPANFREKLDNVPESAADSTL